jgi:hypothetical protein
VARLPDLHANLRQGDGGICTLIKHKIFIQEITNFIYKYFVFFLNKPVVNCTYLCLPRLNPILSVCLKRPLRQIHIKKTDYQGRVANLFTSHRPNPFI